MDRRLPRTHLLRVLIGLAGVIAVIAAAFALRATYAVTMPLAFAFFLAIVVRPVQTWVKQRVPEKLNWLGLVAALVVILAAIALLVGSVWLSADLVAGRSGAYAQKFDDLSQRYDQWASDMGLPEGGPLASAGIRERVTTMAESTAESVVRMAGFGVLVFFFVALMLLESRAWGEKIRAAFRDRDTTQVIEAMHQISSKVRRFLLVRTILGLMSGVLGGLWLWFMGVDFAFLWGFLLFLLNYIPNIGSIIAATPPSILAVAQLGWGMGLVAVGGIVLIEQVIGNFIDPRMQGRAMSASPVVLLFSVLFWGWVWGPAGALIGVPLTMTILIACAFVPSMQPLARLLSKDGHSDLPGPNRGIADAD